MAKAKQGETVKIKTEKSLSIFEAASFYKQITESYKGAREIEIDFKDLESCDTAGIQILYSLKKSGLRDEKKIIFKDPSGTFENLLKEMNIPVNIFI